MMMTASSAVPIRAHVPGGTAAPGRAAEAAAFECIRDFGTIIGRSSRFCSETVAGLEADIASRMQLKNGYASWTARAVDDCGCRGGCSSSTKSRIPKILLYAQSDDDVDSQHAAQHVHQLVMCMFDSERLLPSSCTSAALSRTPRAAISATRSVRNSSPRVRRPRRATAADATVQKSVCRAVGVSPLLVCSTDLLHSLDEESAVDRAAAHSGPGCTRPG
jgi:hypothetical protein